MKKLFLIVFVASFAATVSIADDEEFVGGTFEGRVVPEWLDEPFIPAMRLQEELLFRQTGGDTWVVPAGAIVDGRSMPKLFVSLIGDPFKSGFLKSAVTYDYAVKAKARRWNDAQRMFVEGSVVEGVRENDAKVMYLLLQATGSRWAVRWMSGCYGRCHAADSELGWRPRVDDEKVIALVRWVRQNDPSLQEIEQRAGEAIIETGPHIFGPSR
jgi:hypothetical protein